MNAPKQARPGQSPKTDPAGTRTGSPEGGRIAPRSPEGERIAKVIARAGICSRRDAERLIEEGKVSVNGKVLTSPALNVTPKDRIVVDGEPLPQFEPTRLWRYHKPAGLVTTAKDPEGRPTVFERLPDDMPRVVSIGRLDINTEGLLLLTNDGELARLLELPATGWTRRYRVRAWGDVTQEGLDRLKDGIEVEGVRYGPIEASLDKVQGSNVWLTVGLKEGKNREVKRVLGALGLTVNRLIRLSFGPFQIGDLVEGEVKQVPNRVLMDQLGAHGEAFRAKIEAAEAAVPVAAPKKQPSKPQPGKSASGKPSSAKPQSSRPQAAGKPRMPKPHSAAPKQHSGKPNSANRKSGKPQTTIEHASSRPKLHLPKKPGGAGAARPPSKSAGGPSKKKPHENSRRRP